MKAMKPGTAGIPKRRVFRHRSTPAPRGPGVVDHEGHRSADAFQRHGLHAHRHVRRAAAAEPSQARRNVEGARRPGLQVPPRREAHQVEAGRLEQRGPFGLRSRAFLSGRRFPPSFLAWKRHGTRGVAGCARRETTSTSPAGRRRILPGDGLAKEPRGTSQPGDSTVPPHKNAGTKSRRAGPQSNRRARR